MWFLPLNSLGYLQALLLWDLLSVACFVGGILVLVSSRRAKEIGFLTVAVFAFPPVFITLLQGQTSGLLFLATALVYQSLKRRREIMAGVWLSLLLTKFQLLLPFLILFLWRRRVEGLGRFRDREWERLPYFLAVGRNGGNTEICCAGDGDEPLGQSDGYDTQIDALSARAIQRSGGMTLIHT